MFHLSQFPLPYTKVALSITIATYSLVDFLIAHISLVLTKVEGETLSSKTHYDVTSQCLSSEIGQQKTQTHTTHARTDFYQRCLNREIRFSLSASKQSAVFLVLCLCLNCEKNYLVGILMD